MARTDVIRQKIQNALADTAGKTVSPQDILAQMDSVQYELAQESLAIERDFEFETEAGEAIYDLGLKIYKIDTLIPPASWVKPIEIVTSNEDWKRYSRDPVVTSWPYPIYAFVFDEKLRFLPAPKTTGDLVQIMLYLYPAKTLALATDPETHPRFDLALEYGTLARFRPSEYKDRYDEEVGKQKARQLNPTAGGIIRHQHYTDKTGF